MKLTPGPAAASGLAVLGRIEEVPVERKINFRHLSQVNNF
jgi:hypothetical protein